MINLLYLKGMYTTYMLNFYMNRNYKLTRKNI